VAALRWLRGEIRNVDAMREFEVRHLSHLYQKVAPVLRRLAIAGKLKEAA